MLKPKSIEICLFDSTVMEKENERPDAFWSSQQGISTPSPASGLGSIFASSALDSTHASAQIALWLHLPLMKLGVPQVVSRNRYTEGCGRQPVGDVDNVSTTTLLSGGDICASS